MEEMAATTPPRSWLDSLGTTVSIACAIQCSLFPLLISVLPLLGLGFLLGEGLEKIFLMTSMGLAVSSFSWGFRYHRRLYIFLFLIAAATLILVGRKWVAASLEVPFVVSGTVLLAAGHFLNRRLCNYCRDCAEEQGNDSSTAH